VVPADVAVEDRAIRLVRQSLERILGPLVLLQRR
jgi:hypothetical protein